MVREAEVARGGRVCYDSRSMDQSQAPAPCESPFAKLRLYLSGMCNGAFLGVLLFRAFKPAGILQISLPAMVLFLGLLLNPAFRTWRQLAIFSVFLGGVLLAIEPICALIIAGPSTDFLATRIGGACFVLAGLLFFILSRRERRPD